MNGCMKKQALLVEAYMKGDILKVRHIQISILKDFRTTAIVVRRVTASSGSRTETDECIRKGRSQTIKETCSLHEFSFRNN
jgi:hypothetical protein